MNNECRMNENDNKAVNTKIDVKTIAKFALFLYDHGRRKKNQEK